MMRQLASSFTAIKMRNRVVEYTECQCGTITVLHHWVLIIYCRDQGCEVKEFLATPNSTPTPA